MKNKASFVNAIVIRRSDVRIGEIVTHADAPMYVVMVDSDDGVVTMQPVADFCARMGPGWAEWGRFVAHNWRVMNLRSL